MPFVGAGTKEKEDGYFKKLLYAIFPFLVKKYNGEDPYQSTGINGKLSTENYLVDFRQGFYQTGGNIVTGFMSEGGSNESIGIGHEEKSIKVPIKPIDVLNELERVPSTWSFEALDEKIDILKDKAELVNQEYTLRELEDLIVRLENRKKLKDNTADRAFYKTFDTTNDEKINALCKRHNLVCKDADIFIPELPTDAIKIMKKFTTRTEKLCGKKPVYMVIANESDFKKNWERRDPILLAQSPFGFYYYILGAWDKEMLYLPEL